MRLRIAPGRRSPDSCVGEVGRAEAHASVRHEALRTTRSAVAGARPRSAGQVGRETSAGPDAPAAEARFTLAGAQETRAGPAAEGGGTRGNPGFPRGKSGSDGRKPTLPSVTRRSEPHEVPWPAHALAAPAKWA